MQARGRAARGAGGCNRRGRGLRRGDAVGALAARRRLEAARVQPRVEPCPAVRMVDLGQQPQLEGLEHAVLAQHRVLRDALCGGEEPDHQGAERVRRRAPERDPRLVRARGAAGGGSEEAVLDGRPADVGPADRDDGAVAQRARRPPGAVGDQRRAAAGGGGGGHARRGQRSGRGEDVDLELARGQRPGELPEARIEVRERRDRRIAQRIEPRIGVPAAHEVRQRPDRAVVERIVEAEPVHDVVVVRRPAEVAVAERRRLASRRRQHPRLRPLRERGRGRRGSARLDHPARDRTAVGRRAEREPCHEPTVGHGRHRAGRAVGAGPLVGERVRERPMQVDAGRPRALQVGERRRKQLLPRRPGRIRLAHAAVREPTGRLAQDKRVELHRHHDPRDPPEGRVDGAHRSPRNEAVSAPTSSASASATAWTATGCGPDASSASSS